MTKLTIGMPCYDDYDGVYFTIQTVRAQIHGTDLQDRVQFVVVDNNPDSPHGKLTASFCKKQFQGRPIAKYVPFQEYNGTAVTKNRVFAEAETDYVVCVDCHVILTLQAIKTLLNYYDNNPSTQDLLHGPLWLDELDQLETHLDPVWRGQMFGTWGRDPRGLDPTSTPFEIPMQGMGLFSCRKDAWLGFHPDFRGFGPEEGYIHDKFRRAGRKIQCLPGLRWIHRFGRAGGTPYPHTMENKIRNYIISWFEMGHNLDEMMDHFVKEKCMTRDKMLQILEEIKTLPYFENRQNQINGVTAVLPDPAGMFSLRVEFAGPVGAI